VKAARPEYVALADELAFLREAFELPCTEVHRAQVGTALGSFECIDRYYDAESISPRRRALGDDVISVVAGGESAAPLPAELVEQLHGLREVFHAHDARAPIAELLARFVDATERVRNTLEPSEYVAAVEEEGRLTSEMVLLLFDGDPPRSRFAEFFVRLGIVGNLVDKLCDARDDFARGEVALRPGAAVHARLCAAFVHHATLLVARFPRRVALVRWGAKYFAPLLRRA
jgi:hypothetical protein